ncbi:MAG: glycosyltransferase [Sphaerochaetaceae bacterium]
MGQNIALPLTALMLSASLLMFFITILRRKLSDKKTARSLEIEQKLQRQIINQEIDIDDVEPDDLLPIYARLQNTLLLDKEEMDHMGQLLLNSNLVAYYVRRLHSRSYIKRAQSAVALKYLGRKDIQRALLEALRIERHPVAILQMAHALSLQRVRAAIAPIVSKLRIVEPWTAKRIMAVLYSYKEDFTRYAIRHLDNNRSYMQRLICGFALEFPAEEFRSYLVAIASDERKAARSTALEALLKHFPEELRTQTFTESTHRRTLSCVIQSMAISQEADRIDRILLYSRYKVLHDQIIQSLSEMAMREPAMLNSIRDAFRTSSQKRKREILAKVLENRIEYYLNRITGPEQADIIELITELVQSHYTSAILFFLNRNTDKAIERIILKVVKNLSRHHSSLRSEMRMYLDIRLQKAIGLGNPSKAADVPKPHSEPPRRFQLAVMLIAIIIFFPIVILIGDFTRLATLSWKEIGKLYIVRFNYLLMFYSIAVNMIYIVILVISVRGARVQKLLWEMKDYRFLFTKGMLPSMSIIAPAYNESASIIESTNSLLNQRYPDFELIVVNDGSKDDTLNLLINYYKLEKRDLLVRERLQTRPLRGIYTNKNIPNLIVVDKMNGGKADSLNMGLNVARNEYFCGIDADSLLESEALLRAVSVMLDSRYESIAGGGNICPVNGCSVERGSIDHITLPKKFVARLQSLEYMRAFMAGRVGWAHLNLLLIISGAFGIFNKERTIRTGGYLTKSGRYRKDTVGEDMELVVRLSRYMREMKLPYRVNYAFNANCWTEVPESWKVLHRQRDRWHRGLIDILLFHKRLIGNIRYGRLGTVAMLYYFLFEMIGPFVETQGMIMVAVAALVGLLNIPIALLLFSTTILMGIFVSTASVFVADMDRQMYERRDVLRLLWMAIIENFGPRQYISFWRVSGYFSSMKRSKGWGAQVRKGFAPVAAPTATEQKKSS